MDSLVKSLCFKLVWTYAWTDTLSWTPTPQKDQDWQAGSTFLCIAGLETSSSARPCGHTDCFLQACSGCGLSLDGGSYFSFPTMFCNNPNPGSPENTDTEGSISFQEVNQLPKKAKWDGIGGAHSFMNKQLRNRRVCSKNVRVSFLFAPQELLLYCSEEITLKHFFLTWTLA